MECFRKNCHAFIALTTHSLAGNIMVASGRKALHVPPLTDSNGELFLSFQLPRALVRDKTPFGSILGPEISPEFSNV